MPVETQKPPTLKKYWLKGLDCETLELPLCSYPMHVARCEVPPNERREPAGIDDDVENAWCLWVYVDEQRSGTNTRQVDIFQIRAGDPMPPRNTEMQDISRLLNFTESVWPIMYDKIAWFCSGYVEEYHDLPFNL